MGFQVELALADPELVGLVDDPHRGTDWQHAHQFGDVEVVHAEAAVADLHADAELLVRAVDEIARQGQADLVGAQGIVRAGRHHLGQRIAFGGMLGTNGLRRIPGWILDLVHHLGHPDRRAPAITANTQRVGEHRMTTLGVVVHAVFGDVDDDAFARSGRQDEARRQDDLGTGAGQPGVDAWIGRHHLGVAQVVLLAEVGEGVFVGGLDDLNLADHVFTGWRQRQLQCLRRTRAQQTKQREGTDQGRNARGHGMNPCKEQ